MTKTKPKTHYWTTYHDYKRVYELRSYPVEKGNCFGRIHRLWTGTGWVWEPVVKETHEPLGWFTKIDEAKKALVNKFEETKQEGE